MNINVNDILKKSENLEQNSPYFQWVSKWWCNAVSATEAIFRARTYHKFFIKACTAQLDSAARRRAAQLESRPYFQSFMKQRTYIKNINYIN